MAGWSAFCDKRRGKSISKKGGLSYFLLRSVPYMSTFQKAMFEEVQFSELWHTDLSLLNGGLSTFLA